MLKSDDAARALPQGAKEGVAAAAPAAARSRGGLNRRLVLTGHQALAAAAALFLTGLAGGYLVAFHPSSLPLASPFMMESAPRSWMDDVAANHRLFARQQAALLENVEAGLPRPGLGSVLASGTGIAFTLPDLQGEALDFQGGRLLIVDGRPAGQLRYLNRDGETITVSFLRVSTGEEESGDLAEIILDDLGMITFRKGEAAFAVTGPSSEPALETIARKVADSI